MHEHSSEKPTTERFRCHGRDVELRVVPNDLITRRIHTHRAFYEQPLLDAIRALDRPGVYLDVGAHIGNHSVFFALFCPSTAVYAFEPNGAVLPALWTNQQIDPKIHVIPYPVHEAPRVRLVPPAAGNTGTARVEPSKLVAGAIETRRLDDYGPISPGCAAVIKIDVEGAEVAVLNTARRHLQGGAVVVVECQTDAAKKAVEHVLTPYGYRCQGVYCSTPTYLYTRP